MKIASSTEEAEALKAANPCCPVLLVLPDGQQEVHLPHGAGIRVYPPRKGPQSFPA
jgi:hypothetical protein